MTDPCRARDGEPEPYRGVAALFEGDSDIRGARVDWTVESSTEITYKPKPEEATDHD